jgi:hypothetical protein
MITEKQLFQNQKMTTISVEIPKTYNEQLVKQYHEDVAKGVTSLTFEQYIGTFVITGHKVGLYLQLKKIFG